MSKKKPKQPFDVWWEEFKQVARKNYYKEDIIRENFRSADFWQYWEDGKSATDAFYEAGL